MEIQEIDWKEKLGQIQAIEPLVANADVTLAILWEGKRQNDLFYHIKYVNVTQGLQGTMKELVQSQLRGMTEIEPYAMDNTDADSQNVLGLESNATNFVKILESLAGKRPGIDIVETYEELLKATAYLFIVRLEDQVSIIGYKRIPENWKLKRKFDLRHVVFDEQTLEAVPHKTMWSLAKDLGVIYFDGNLFISSRDDLETGLKYRERIMAIATNFYTEVGQMNLFANAAILSERVSRNTKFLKKIAQIKNLGHYSNPQFMQKLRDVSTLKGWDIEFEGEMLKLTAENVEAVLTVLQNKRLFSELTEETFDVGSAKKLGS